MKDKVQNQSSLIEFLYEEIRTLNNEKDSLQAKVDELMFEYCPEDMTEEQISNYSRCVRWVD